MICVPAGLDVLIVPVCDCVYLSSQGGAGEEHQRRRGCSYGSSLPGCGAQQGIQGQTFPGAEMLRCVPHSGEDAKSGMITDRHSGHIPRRLDFEVLDEQDESLVRQLVIPSLKSDNYPAVEMP